MWKRKNGENSQGETSTIGSKIQNSLKSLIKEKNHDNVKKICTKADLASVCSNLNSDIQKEIQQLMRFSYDNTDSTECGMQATINKLIDLQVSQLTKIMSKKGDGEVSLPDISQKFLNGPSFYKISGEFQAMDGTFSDLSSLQRLQDASVSFKDLKFIASCAFNLTKAIMQYKSYKLRYGVISIKGKISAEVKEVRVAATITIDYNQLPCRIKLQELDLNKDGRIEIKITGLRPLNKLISKIAAWIIEKWQDEIIEQIKKELNSAIVSHLESNFN
ncbi:hypothetical protein QAD02_014733 [Eretmocerus hayati]|uniref:Uncharacterized protein n=1 Tax=Eretmocerus hayati TaxID=131215 RepID=A0ACC2P7E1_9HYME|nr:hypothetical protein QAD02_014733 [Eretmocerus hayati]